VVGAISASAPSNRALPDHLVLMRDEVMAAARALSAELGQASA
jgi:IclR family acetate operon transcriptional repressor